MTCPKCKGSGLLPFIKPDRTISHYAKVFCDCHPVYGDNAHTSIPLTTQGNRPGVGSRTYKQQRGRLHLYQDDFDFSVSYSVYRSLCQEHGWIDPGPDYPPEKEVMPLLKESKPEWTQRQWQCILQNKAMTLYLQNKVNELLASRKPKGQY